MTIKLVKYIWKILDLLLYILGFGCIVGALFLWNLIAGWSGLGISLILTGLLIDLPSISQRGGD
ncbi:DUF1056 family protein [Lactobacillus crispatus]|uniref:DUF1056 family protein n=1 Tax=Lactobacillus crispatus TaxID=47770 RepID=A0A4R6CTB8_9LACO|nr:DUF1056 family protein [Lactobacillus crispatus]KWU08514.1 hypothetical protein AEL97_09900 [Lactobacillus crispatus]MCT7741473.1 DUF1056 family protein [Lactobacillus crispatus]MCT7787831.1 DUF1056 family protein [Lactobacillus crispatus]MCT7803017.1 DUF1056 family protein [Lactobacillus crispatus]MCT7840471.1 DUF1056 family protein [Lactobacillus crispatus]